MIHKSNRVDSQTCVLDVLRHIPRVVFSQKQNEMIQWAMWTLGVPHVPSDYQMKNLVKSIQHTIGISTIRYSGSLGNVYYINDIRSIIAQVSFDSLLFTVTNYLFSLGAGEPSSEEIT